MPFVCILWVCDQLYGSDSINFPETVWSKAFFIIHVVIALFFFFFLSSYFSLAFLLLSSSLLISLYEVGVFMTHQIRVSCGVWVLKGPHAICCEVIRARLPKKWVHISHIEVNTTQPFTLSAHRLFIIIPACRKITCLKTHAKLMIACKQLKTEIKVKISSRTAIQHSGSIAVMPFTREKKT